MEIHSADVSFPLSISSSSPTTKEEHQVIFEFNLTHAGQFLASSSMQGLNIYSNSSIEKFSIVPAPADPGNCFSDGKALFYLAIPCHSAQASFEIRAFDSYANVIIPHQGIPYF